MEQTSGFLPEQLFIDEFFAFNVNYQNLNNSPNSRYFDVTYDFIDKSVGLRYYASASLIPDQHHEEYYTLETAEDVLRIIASKHPEEFILEDTLAKVKLFFRVMKETTIIEGPIAQDGSWCSVCESLDYDHFTFYLFPAIPDTPITEACVYLEWNYGCLTHRLLMGEVRKAGHTAMATLDQIFAYASSDFKENVQSAITSLRGEMKS